MKGKNFGHLHVPDHWQQYWSRYPQGYTILESLINWVSQVDKMTDNVNDWNTYLDEFVKTYDIELQSTVSNTIDKMNEDGVLAQIINQTVFGHIQNDLNNKRDKNVKITGTDLDTSSNDKKIKPVNISDELMLMFSPAGTVSPIIPNKGVTKEKYADKSIEALALAPQYRFRKQLYQQEDLNLIYDDGLYFISTVVNKPSSITNGILEVSQLLDRWIFQKITDYSNPTTYYIRSIDKNNNLPTEWKKNSHINDLTKLPYLTAEDDLNNYTENNGHWLAISSKNTPDPTLAWMFSNYLYKTSNTNRWVEQTATPSSVNNVPMQIWKRRGYISSAVTEYIFEDWKRVFHEEEGSSQQLQNKTVVNLGDSIFGNVRGSNSVSNFIALKTGATVHNIGFGGSRIAQHSTGWDAFSLYHLADEIVKPDSDQTKWKLQDEAISANIVGMPAYFADHLEDLKKIDWNKVEYVTIAGGTNDYTAGVELDNANNRYDTTTFAGSLRYSLEKIMTKYKHLKVLLCSPMYRFWRDGDGNFIDDSDIRQYNGRVLPDFVAKEIEVAREYKTPIVDNYHELGINKFNKEHYFPSNDGTHPNSTGNKKLGEKIASMLISNF